MGEASASKGKRKSSRARKDGRGRDMGKSSSEEDERRNESCEEDARCVK